MLPKDALISKLAEMLQDHEGIPPDEQILLFGQQKLEFGRTISDYKIPNGSTISLHKRGPPMYNYDFE